MLNQLFFHKKVLKYGKKFAYMEKKYYLCIIKTKTRKNMNEKVFAIFSESPFSHNDCLILISAPTAEDAISIAIDKTTISDLFNEDAIKAKELPLLSEIKNYLCIFADDITILT